MSVVRVIVQHSRAIARRERGWGSEVLEWFETLSDALVRHGKCCQKLESGCDAQKATAEGVRQEYRSKQQSQEGQDSADPKNPADRPIGEIVADRQKVPGRMEGAEKQSETDQGRNHEQAGQHQGKGE